MINSKLMTEQKEEFESLTKRIENGDFTEEEAVDILKQLDDCYSVLGVFLKKVKVEKISQDLKK